MKKMDDDDDLKDFLLGFTAQLREQFGDSTKETRKAIVKAFGGVELMKLASDIWYGHTMYSSPFAKFATAVDMGYRIRKSEESK